MIKIVMIDDEAVFLEQFREVLQRIMAEEKVDFCLDTIIDPKKLLETKNDYDLYFFDIVMPEIPGIELAGKLRDKGNNREFVFVSNHEQYIRDSMAVRPCGFVRKPHLEEDLREVLLRLRSLFAVKGAEVILKSNKKDYAVQLPRIMFINSDGHYLRLMHADGTNALIRNSMKVIQEELQKFDFIRVSNRCVINLQYLQSINKNEIFLKNGHREKITGKYLEEVFPVLHSWIEEHKSVKIFSELEEKE